MEAHDPQQPSSGYLLAGLIGIFLLAAWAASFSRSCQSDGCIGVVIPAGGALIALAIQLFALIPFFCFRRARSELPFGLQAAIWAGGSLAAFIVPMLFAKL